MSEDILAQFMEPKADPRVVPATQPVVEITEEERRAQEARDYLASLPPAQRQRTEEEIQEEAAALRATIPMANGKPIPEPSGLTQEQMRNNPSNYQPAIDPFLAQAGRSDEQIVMGVTREEPPVQQAAPVKPQDTDTRQAWVCVQSDGIRTMDNKGQVHPIFRSDVHLMDVMVRCPVCDSTSVRKVLDGEDLDLTERDAYWMHNRTRVMGQHPQLRQVEGDALSQKLDKVIEALDRSVSARA